MRITEGTCAHCSTPVEWSEEDGAYAATDPRCTLSAVWLCPTNEPHNVAEDVASLASHDASLGVGHIWTAVQCPAYRSLNPSDCTCQTR